MDHKMRTYEAARYVGLSAATLARMRVRGDGPTYAKAGPRIVVYAKGDLDAWLGARTCQSTTEWTASCQISDAAVVVSPKQV